MKTLYNIIISFYAIAIHVAAFFNTKAKLWVKGRKNWLANYENLTDGRKMVIWFHCASLGEYEMARPVIEKFKSEIDKDWFILLSFFSPSGYEIQKGNKFADAVVYLPLDTRSNSLNFVQMFNPDIAVFVKYEIWLNYFDALKTNGTSIILMNAVFNKEQRFFKWYGNMFKQALKQCNKIFVQDQASFDVLKTIEIQSEISGDTRFDRVIDIKNNSNEIDDVVSKWAKGSFIIVAGSTWPREEFLINKAMPLIKDKVKWIIAPHDVSKYRIQRLKEKIKDSVLLSEIDRANDSNVLIVDSIGKLAQIYSLANLAVVGGGFTGKLHNILEPAVYGIPVYIGPIYDKFHEAKVMVEYKTVFVINNEIELAKAINDFIYNVNEQMRIRHTMENLFELNKGAVKKVFDYINQTVKST